METHCDNGKVIYDTARAANVQIKSLAHRKSNHKYGIYKCSLGDHFHITATTKIKHRSPKVDKYPIEFKASGNIKTNKKKK